MTGRMRALVSLPSSCSQYPGSHIRHTARPRLQAAARQHRDASTDRTSRDRQPPAAVPDRLARERTAASACAADPDRARSSRGSREVARSTRSDPSRLRHAFPRSTTRRHERLLLPRRAPRGAARAIDLRLHATEGAHLRQRSRQAARPRRRDVEHARRRGRADTRRADPSLALAHRLQGREEARAEASGERRLPSGLTTPAGCERDAPRLVHRRAAQRVRDHRSAAGAVRRGTSAPRFLSSGGSRRVSRDSAPLGLRELTTSPREAALGERDELVDPSADLDTRRCVRCHRRRPSRSCARKDRMRPR